MSVRRTFDVIIPAAGRGTRFGGDKLAADLGGMSVLARSVAAFVGRADVARVVVANADGQRPPHLPDHAKLLVVRGGTKRVETVSLAMQACEAEWIAIHDAARPLVPVGLIDRCFAAGTCVPCVPVTGTVKRVSGDVIEATVPRENLWLAQTPQCCRRADWLAAYAEVPTNVTDDAMLLEHHGIRVQRVDGEVGNLKLTTRADLQLAKALL